MIRTETYGKWIDGTNLIRTYSDDNKYIERDGIKYAEAVDPERFNRTYTETNEPIEKEEADNE